ncbi:MULTISPECIES: TetR/AcrR family transcriptional regulator [Mycobacterium]|uniref:TetR family transcriptional regulator n=1 Tax=Mycobacterium kiyosense TaxID=2871094 RepID=A0A9P3Q6N6_9MYCO|nr:MULTISPECIES: TetR/AcrR family transcriptional regulator [Mycobacterium]BDB40477.1 TetR family transcriptional regulator [Mycobacterium kiyosense]BDE12295.1 TetR family transcriptional regulator [Mycobacterium sp. 20KCMC460]GLB84120.1 TetR family transcriptional regulator [Mycobacterium kiyosense]GLB88533.1 TetR family transcriptional regulator [Mycobacterium kiyosense]GLB94838.1 TetR family transcriptional regulator [Mycobacterium kiyosense]
MRSHGWSGNTPTSEQEAINRILDAADEIIAERGNAMRIADVARAIGVTRQTVYRYFPSTRALQVATAMRSGDGFLDKLTRHLQGRTTPLSAIVEGVAFAIEELADDDPIVAMLTTPKMGGFAHSITSDTSTAFGRAMLDRYDVDWEAHGFDDAALDELCEFTLRLLQSFCMDRGDPPRSPSALRGFLTRTLGPALIYPRLAQTINSLNPTAAPRRTGPRSVR